VLAGASARVLQQTDVELDAEQQILDRQVLSLPTGLIPVFS
jgi:hypothetical protein